MMLRSAGCCPSTSLLLSTNRLLARTFCTSSCKDCGCGMGKEEEERKNVFSLCRKCHLLSRCENNLSSITPEDDSSASSSSSSSSWNCGGVGIGMVPLLTTRHVSSHHPPTNNVWPITRHNKMAVIRRMSIFQRLSVKTNEPGGGASAEATTTTGEGATTKSLNNNKKEWHDPSFMEGESVQAKEAWLETLLARSSSSSSSSARDDEIDAMAYCVVLNAWAESNTSEAPCKAESWIGRLERHHASAVAAAAAAATTTTTTGGVNELEPTVNCCNAVIKAWAESNESTSVLRAERWLQKMAKAMMMEEDSSKNGDESLPLHFLNSSSSQSTKAGPSADVAVNCDKCR